MPCPPECQSQINDLREAIRALDSRVKALEAYRIENRIVYGSVRPPDQAEGEGFTVARQSAGVFVVSFDRRFPQPPTVVVVISDPSGGNDDIAKVNDVSEGSFSVQVSDIGADFAREDTARFSFVALGRHE